MASMREPEVDHAVAELTELFQREQKVLDRIWKLRFSSSSVRQDLNGIIASHYELRQDIWRRLRLAGRADLIAAGYETLSLVRDDHARETIGQLKSALSLLTQALEQLLVEYERMPRLRMRFEQQFEGVRRLGETVWNKFVRLKTLIQYKERNTPAVDSEPGAAGPKSATATVRPSIDPGRVDEFAPWSQGEVDEILNSIDSPEGLQLLGTAPTTDCGPIIGDLGDGVKAALGALAVAYRTGAIVRRWSPDTERWFPGMLCDLVLCALVFSRGQKHAELLWLVQQAMVFAPAQDTSTPESAVETTLGLLKKARLVELRTTKRLGHRWCATSRGRGYFAFTMQNTWKQALREER